MKALDRFQRWVASEVLPLIKGRTFRAAVDVMKDDELLEAWAIVSFLEKQIEERKAKLRKRLIDRANLKGSPYEDKQGQPGGVLLESGGHRVRVQRRVSALPNEEVFRRILADAALPAQEAFTPVTKDVLDMSKVAQLISVGKLSADDVESARDVNYSLTVKVSEEMYGYLTSQLYETAQPLDGGRQ